MPSRGGGQELAPPTTTRWAPLAAGWRGGLVRSQPVPPPRSPQPCSRTRLNSKAIAPQPQDRGALGHGPPNQGWGLAAPAGL